MQNPKDEVMTKTLEMMMIPDWQELCFISEEAIPLCCPSHDSD